MYLVTGATGNVGAELVRALSAVDESKVMPTVEQITGRPPRTIRAWANAHAREFE